MLDASTELLNRIAETSVVTFKATLALADGTMVELSDDNEDFMEGGMSLEEATSSTSSFDVGAAVIGQLTLILNNYDERFSSYDFTDATIVPYVGVELDDGTEWLQRGVFTVEQPDSYGYTITLTALDNMSLLETEFSEVAAIYPATVQGLIEAICNHCGITLATTGFDNYSYSIDEAPSDTTLTCLAAVGYLAQIVGCYARMNKDGELCIEWYDTTAFDSEDWLDGGEFDEDSPYSTGDTADGGDFEDYSTGDTVDGGAFVDRPYLHLYAHTSCTVTTDDVVITGVQVTASDGTITTETTEETTEEDEDGNEVTTTTVTETEETVSGETELYGADGYIITIESNPFIAYGTAADVAEMIGAKVVGMQFRPFSATGLADPTAEAGDPVYLEDVRGNAYQSYLTSLSWKAGNAETYTCSAETPSRNSASTYSATTAAIAAATQAATSALNKSATLSVTVDGIISKVESEYTTTEDLEELLGDYATTSAVSATLSNYSTTTETAEMIASEVTSALYTTDSDGNTTAIYATTSEVTQTAEDITSTVTATYSALADLASAQTGANLLQDGGFEAADYWTGLPSGMSLDGDNPHSGTYSMACTGATNYAYLNHPYGEDAKSTYSSIAVEGGVTYRISAYAMASEDAVWSSSNTKVRVGTADGNDTLITAMDVSTSTLEAGGGWTYRTATWTNSAGYAEVQIRLVESVSSGTVWWDDIRFEVDTATNDDVEDAVSDATSTITAAYTSAITQSADEILSEVAASYVDTETGATYATKSYVDQQDDAIELAVAETYATQEDLSEVEDAADAANTTAEEAYAAATALYGTCSTAASTAAKVVTCSDFVLFSGASIAVTFTYANTAGAITLNVNGTGALSVYVSGATASTSNYILWSAGTTVEFVYNGTYWLYAGGATSYKVTCGTAAATAAKTATQADAVVCKGTNAVVTWTYGNSYEGAITLNLGSTAAKSIYYGSAVTSSSNLLEINATETLELVFSGAYWYVADSASLTRNATLAITVDEIEASVSEVYETTGLTLAQIADLAITAEEITSTVSSTYLTIADAEDTYATTDDVEDAVSDATTTITKAYTSAITQTAEDVTTTFTSSTGSNLLTDPGFESTAYGATLPDGFAYSTTSPHSGDYCMACTGSSGTRYYFNHTYGDATDPVAITVEPDETYTYSMWYKKSSSSAEWSSSNMKLRIATADGNNTLIASHTTSSIGTDWTQITGTWTNSAGYTEVYVMVATSVTSGTVYVDDAFFGTYTASGTLIRESSDGVEVAKYSGSSYSTTRTLMAADGFHVQDSSGTDLTVVDSDGMTVYAGSSMAAEFAADSVVLGGNFTWPLYITSSDVTTTLMTKDNSSYAEIQMGQQETGPAGYLTVSQDNGNAGLSAYAFDNIVLAEISAKANGDLGDGSAYVSCSIDSTDASVDINADKVNILADSTKVMNITESYTDVYNDIRLPGVIRDSSSGNVFTPQSDSGNTTVGYTRYANASGATSIYGDSVRLYSNEGVYMYTPNSSEKRLRYVDCGVETVTPTAGEPTEFEIGFNVTFESAPYVVLTPVTSLPGTTVLGVGVLPDSRTTTGCTGVITRTSSTDTAVMWIAVGYLA